MLKTTLTVLFNKCLEEGKIPKAWENAVIILLHKKGDIKEITEIMKGMAFKETNAGIGQEGVTKMLNERETELTEWLKINCPEFDVNKYKKTMLYLLNPWYARGDNGVQRNVKIAGELNCNEDVVRSLIYKMNSLDVTTKMDECIAKVEDMDSWHWYTGIVAGGEEDYERRYSEHCKKHGVLVDEVIVESRHYDLICVAEMTGILRLKELSTKGIIGGCWNEENGYDSPSVLEKAKRSDNFKMYVLRTKELYKPVRHPGMEKMNMKIREEFREPGKMYCLNNATNCGMRSATVEQCCLKFKYAAVCVECNLGFDTNEGRLYHEYSEHKVAECSKCSFSGEIQNVGDHYMENHV